jgi:hypothetical protein
VAVVSLPVGLACGHEVITTKLTWSKEVARVVYNRCAGCHRPEGKAFSLLKYEEARPWAKAIQEEVLRRRMPPWNAVKGFGEFRHDLGLSQEEIHLLADWVEGGAPEGDPNLMPSTAKQPVEIARMRGVRREFRGSWTLGGAVRLLGVEMGRMAEGTSFKLVAELPDGARMPLLWIEGYSAKAHQSYEFAAAALLPAGARVVAYPSEGVRLKLVTGSVRGR